MLTTLENVGPSFSRSQQPAPQTQHYLCTGKGGTRWAGREVKHARSTEPGISVPRIDTQKTPGGLPVLCSELPDDGDDSAQS